MQSNNLPTISLTNQELSELSKLCLNMEYLEEQAARCDALVDIFAEALESMHEKGTQPTDGATYGRVAEVIREYSVKTKSDAEDIHGSLSNFIGNIRVKIS